LPGVVGKLGDAGFTSTAICCPICPPERPLTVAVTQLGEAVTAKASFSVGELFTVTFCAAGGLPPAAAVNESGPGGVRLSVGQSEHDAEIPPVTPRVVGSLV
jgi:hypothetical protein